MKRRSFLRTTGIAAAALMPGSRRLFGMLAPTPSALTIAPTKAATMPLDFTGVSIESPQLYNPAYFAPSNTSLVDAFRKLSRNGILRSGGHLSDVARWNGPNGDFSTPKQDAGIARGKTYWEWKLTDPSVRDTKDGAITPDSIKNLKGFLDATGWRLIYGLNFGCGSIERAADEAAFVSKAMGERLIAFQLGNEDDQFAGNPTFRSRDYNFDAYYADYQAFVAGIRKAVPGAKFGGPDVAGNMDWVQRFAEKPDKEAIFISSHFYAMGPAKDPKMDAPFLLGPNARLARQIGQVQKAVTAAGVPYRMTEGNSCFGGGKPNVSDAYASSLWGADYLLQCASAGYAGVNLHGGGDGYYTSIAVGPQLSTQLRPLYFGMQFADQFAGADLYGCELTGGANANAYFGRRGRERLLGIVNKGGAAVEVAMPTSLLDRRPATEVRLKGPAVDATSGVTLTSGKAAAGKTFTVDAYSGLLLKWA